ncbi:DUF1801 domain-containing protein [Kibdelosporangium aridum]|uniref:DUF1801 domain-containing protein n=1 Tax=Kibdelosporangium aridum TaxID=2030 RepID=A0A428Z4R7_KIBAR|nr:DUF1801 domain-containing protein [Kibdelosporangium aridum]RSM81626.1 DUF1801 domain-containing protein [Kibdelosporangium aridum]
MTEAKKTATKKTKAADDDQDGFSDFERQAMKDRAAELRKSKARGKGAAKAAADLEDVIKTIAEMPDPDRTLAEQVHAIVTKEAPDLAPRLWYGMPAYAKNGKVLCFFLGAEKDNVRYSTLGFSDVAALDDGTMWPTAFALTEKLTKAQEKTISELVRKAAS